jgi:hypothetical protein
VASRPRGEIPYPRGLLANSRSERRPIESFPVGPHLEVRFRPVDLGWRERIVQEVARLNSSSPQSQARAGDPAAGLPGRATGPERHLSGLCYLLLKKNKTRRQCEKLIPCFPRAVVELRQSGLAQLVTLGETLHCWSEEIARMWRFTRCNGITEGFHNKMEMISRQAYGFRNFENYRQRVQVLCS